VIGLNRLGAGLIVLSPKQANHINGHAEDQVKGIFCILSVFESRTFGIQVATIIKLYNMNINIVQFLIKLSPLSPGNFILSPPSWWSPLLSTRNFRDWFVVERRLRVNK